MGNKKNEWKRVTIGGVTGIMAGVAANYAVDGLAAVRYGDDQQPVGQQAMPGGAAASEETPDIASSPAASEESAGVAPDGMKVAVVDQSLSFGDAFAQARSQTGPDGVFEWRGGLYSTCTEEEWNRLHPQQAVEQPEVAEVADSNEANSHNADDGESNPAVGGSHSLASADEPEVHFLGMETVETDSGAAVNVGRVRFDGGDVALVDVDGDQVFDVVVSDRNNNGEIEADEVSDISSERITVAQFAAASASGNGTDVQAGMYGAADTAGVTADDASYADVSSI